MPDVTPTPYHHFIPTPLISPLPTPGHTGVTVQSMDAAGALLPLLLALAVVGGTMTRVLIRRRR